MEIFASSRSFGGWTKMFSHPSESCGGTMKCSVYLPPQAESSKVPVLYWLSGLTCTHENFITKAGAQKFAAELGIMLVAPDTSPREAGIDGEDDAYDLGTGAGFYINATQQKWASNYRMEDYIIQELPKIIATHFPVLKDHQSILGHSMGGLVVQQYLRGESARQPDASVFLGVPHRGAMLCDLRKNWWVFRLFMGDKAALQLSPGDSFHDQAIVVPGLCGTVVGDVGDGNQSVPGDDDGTLTVAEASFPGADDSVVVSVGHSGLPRSAESIRQVLYFLRQGKFAD